MSAAPLRSTDPSHALKAFAKQVRKGTVGRARDGLRLGVDLGTANIVLSVVDAANAPVAGAWRRSGVVRDGVVVDWQGAVLAVKDLKAVVEGRLGCRLTRASVAIPPGIGAGTIRVFTNVLEAAGLDADEVVDEPVAAARVLGLADGCVIDVGHGTTGVSILAGGRVVRSIDEATGGHHMTLVVAGARRLPYDAAEKFKVSKAHADEVFGIIRPTLEKMASIARRALEGFDPPTVQLVGGSSSFAGAPEVFADVLGRPVFRPVRPLFVTPLGIPMTVPRPQEEDA